MVQVLAQCRSQGLFRIIQEQIDTSLSPIHSVSNQHQYKITKLLYKRYTVFTRHSYVLMLCASNIPSHISKCLCEWVRLCEIPAWGSPLYPGLPAASAFHCSVVAPAEYWPGHCHSFTSWTPGSWDLLISWDGCLWADEADQGPALRWSLQRCRAPWVCTATPKGVRADAYIIK